MKDRFKFRVWDNINKRYEKDLTMINKDGDLCYQDGHKYCNGEHPEDFTIEQCTGLEDRNGRLIFEGDIVKPSDPEVKGLYVVKWNEKTYAFDFQKLNGFESQKFYYLYSDDVVIIGNIHDNQ